MLVVGVVTVTFGERATEAGYPLESRLLWRGSKTDAADRGGRIFDLAGARGPSARGFSVRDRSQGGRQGIFKP